MNCHCCDSNDVSSIMNDVYGCNSCKHIYIDYLGDDIQFHANTFRELKAQRRDIDEIDKDGKITPLFHEKRKKIVQDRVQYIKHLLSSSYDCLDVGAGAGTFALELKSHVKSVECTELSPTLINECEHLGFKTYAKDFVDIEFDKQYDLVFAWHVLEHVKNIEEFKKKMLQVATKHVIIEVPLLVALNGKGRRRGLKMPNNGRYDGHAHYFTEKSFTLFFEKDFEIVELKEGVQTPALFSILKRKKI